MTVRAELRPQGPYSLRVSGRHASDATRVVADGTYRATVRVDDRLERVHAVQRRRRDDRRRGGQRRRRRPRALRTRSRRRPLGVPAPVRRRSAARRDAAPSARPSADAHRHRRAGTPARRRRAADPGEPRAPDRAHDRPRGDPGARRAARATDVGRARAVLAGGAGAPRPRRPPRRLPDPALPLVRPRAAEGAALRRRRCAARDASAGSGRGRSASSASRASAATSTGSPATSASRSWPRRSGAAGPSPRRPTSLLAPYGEWAGLASVYLLAGFARGLIPLPHVAAA